MKKITFALAFLTFGMQAQNFPSPYCDIDDSGTTVEEITSVDFVGNSITNSDTSLILIDKTINSSNVQRDVTYTIEVAGNTVGDFDNDIVAFIDWNQNDVLDDAGEVYEIGTLNNSTGNDGVTVSGDITVPVDALVGVTRIRITKIFTDDDSVAEIDPCAISFNPFGQGVFPGFGQALDFTLNVGTLGVNSFDESALSIYPNPSKDILNIDYKSELSALKVYNLLGQEILSENISAKNFKLNISMLTTGTYFLRLFSDSESNTFKIMKQ